MTKKPKTALRSPHQSRVDTMMTLALQELPKTPTIPNEKVRKLRVMLILEEALETCEALGFKLVYPDGSSIKKAVKSGDFRYKETDPDLVEIADGCADISVVTIGTLSACGIADEDIIEAVDKNNLQKFGAGGYRNAHGKWCKPPNHKPPDILSLLKEQGYDPATQTD